MPSNVPFASFVTSLGFGSTPGVFHGLEGGVNKKYSGYGIFNVKDFGATGDGTTDDHAAIQNAMTAAWAHGGAGTSAGPGATVYFPSGTYNLGTTGLNDSTATIDGKIFLKGDGREATCIIGTVTGWALRKSTQNYSIIGISGLHIVNNNFVAGSGAVYLPFCDGAHIYGCDFGGFTGLDMADDQFNSVISHTKITAPFNNQLTGTVGLATAQNTLICVSVQGYDVGIMTGSTFADRAGSSGAQGVALIGCRTESCNTGVMWGKSTLGASSTCGGIIVAHTTERCSPGIYVNSAANLTIQSSVIQGTIAVGKNLDSITWSANVATVHISSQNYTLNSLGWTSGTRNIAIQNATPTGYNTIVDTFVTGTYVNSTTFTYPLLSNPGGTSASGLWSFNQQWGLYLSNAQYTVFDAISISQNSEVSNIYIGNVDGRHITFNSCLSGTWTMPASTKKAGVQFNNSDNPAHTLAFGDLPGQAGVDLSTPLEGMTYDITDCNTSTFLATAAAGGTGATAHRRVRYNASSAIWQVVG